jgi:hypothetical protein
MLTHRHIRMTVWLELIVDYLHRPYQADDSYADHHHGE